MKGTEGVRMHCIEFAKWHSFKFTDQQRGLIRASLPQRVTKELKRKNGHLSQDAFAEMLDASRDRFIEDIEDAIGHYAVDRQISDGMPSGKFRTETGKMAENARSLRKAIERLPKENLACFDAHFFRFGLASKRDDKTQHLAVDRDVGLFVEMLEQFESICNDYAEEPAKTGVNKRFEYSVAAQIVVSYEQFIGKASASPNGALFRIVKTICDISGVIIGEDLFQRAVAEYSCSDGD